MLKLSFVGTVLTEATVLSGVKGVDGEAYL